MNSVWRPLWAGLLGLSHVLVLMLAEIVRLRGDMANAVPDEYVTLPLIHSQAWLAGGLLAALALLPRRSAMCWIAWAVALLGGAYVVAELPVARYFGYHPGFELLADFLASPHLFVSARAEIDRGFWLLLLFWFLMQGGLALSLRRLVASQPRRMDIVWPAALSGARNVGRLLTTLVVLAALVAAAFRIGSVVPGHPIAALLLGDGPGAGKFFSGADANAGVATAYAPLRHDTVNEPDAERQAHAAIAAGVGGTRPNVVFIVLDSIGARQIVGSAGIDRQRMPALRRLHDSGGVLFDAMIVNSPDRLRANLAINTGGDHPTWLGTRDVLAHRWRGRLMAGEFRQAGYRTGLFAAPDLDQRGLGPFLAQAGYETFTHFGTLPGPLQEAERFNSLGGRDAPMLGRASAWLVEAGRMGRPFFLHYHTNSPQLPEALADESPGAGGTAQAVPYGEVLAAADRVVAGLVDTLERTGQRDNTLIVVTGDRGLGLGADGRQRNRGFDESIRGFALFALPPGRGPAMASKRVISNGDLYPTLAALAGVGRWSVHWRNALAFDWKPRIQYFVHDAGAGDWGLRDGKWKFISRAQGMPAIYDLDADPGETNNVAGAVRQRRQYDAMTVRWYLAKNREFLAQLDGVPDFDDLGPAELASFGLKRLALGVAENRSELGYDVVPARVFHPQELIFIEALWSGFPLGREVEYRWRGPQGFEFTQKVGLTQAVHVQRVAAALSRPLALGAWTLTAILDGTEQRQASFEVRSDRPLRFSGQAYQLAPKARPVLRSVAIGKPTEGMSFSAVNEIQATDRFTIRSEWLSGLQDESLRLVLISPRNEALAIPFELPAGVLSYDQPIAPPKSMWTGVWRVEVHGDRGVLGGAEFRVAP